MLDAPDLRNVTFKLQYLNFEGYEEMSTTQCPLESRYLTIQTTRRTLILIRSKRPKIMFNENKCPKKKIIPQPLSLF